VLNFRSTKSAPISQNDRPREWGPCRLERLPCSLETDDATGGRDTEDRRFADYRRGFGPTGTEGFSSGTAFTELTVELGIIIRVARIIVRIKVRVIGDNRGAARSD
jgi:hypothetical protein